VSPSPYEAGAMQPKVHDLELCFDDGVWASESQYQSCVFGESGSAVQLTLPFTTYTHVITLPCKTFPPEIGQISLLS
jgi:hypothetical protein